MQNPPHRVVTGFPSMITAQTLKNQFQQIIAALGMDGYFYGWNVYLDGICKLPFIIFVDLFGELSTNTLEKNWLKISCVLSAESRKPSPIGQLLIRQRLSDEK